MSASSARAGGAPLVKVGVLHRRFSIYCGDGLEHFHHRSWLSILSIGVHVSDWIKQGSNAVFAPQALTHSLTHSGTDISCVLHH